jgi:REP element-mobilizing transposase RayT
MSFYRRNLPHLQRDYKQHFITFCTKRKKVLPGWARQIVLDCCLHDHGTKYNLYAAVVMPDHVHLILTPLVDLERQAMIQVFEILKTIKSVSAHKINRCLGERGTVWQEESFDHVIRSSDSLDAKIDYVTANPVRRGMVGVASEYPYMWRKAVETFSPILPTLIA